MDSDFGTRYLNSSNLASDFGVRSACTSNGLPYLYQCLESPPNDRTRDAANRDYEDWGVVFGEVTGRDPADPRWVDSKQFRQYANRLGVQAAALCPSRLIFAVHSYYAVLVKLLTRCVVQRCHAPEPAVCIPGSTESDSDIRQFMGSLDQEETYADLGVKGFLDGDGFRWCRHIWADAGIAVGRSLLSAVRRYDLAGNAPRQEGDVLKGLYHGLVPRAIRHQLGEYYTPDWLAEHVLDRAGYDGQPGARVLDPACGSGTFLVQAIQQLRREAAATGRSPSANDAQAVLDHVVGIDVNPLAVLAARANYLLAIHDLLREVTDTIEVPVYLADSIVSPAQSRDLFSPPPTTRQPPPERFDFVVGNPPWVGWESLPEDYRQQLKPLWIRYGLFPHTGMSAILGQGKKDLSMLMSYAVTDRWLKEGGRLGFLITQSVFKTAGAGKAFRRFRLGGKADLPLRVERVDDMSDFQPFEEASTRTAVFVWTKGQATEYPVPYETWQKVTVGDRIPQDATLDEVHGVTRCLEMRAEPVAEDDPGSPWLTLRPGLHPVVRRLLGKSDYHAHEGINTGGANGVYWLEVREHGDDGLMRVQNLTAGAKRKIEQVEARIESDLVYPLLRGREVRRWQAEPTASILLVQDVERRCGINEQRLRSKHPHTLSYLQQFETPLRARAAFRRYFQRKRDGRAVDTAPFYSMFDVGEYTMAPHKVVWHRMVTPVEAAVVGSIDGKPIMPQETHAFVPCESADEAAYLCGMLNSVVFNFAAYSYSQTGGKSFASPHILAHIQIPAFDRNDTEQQQVAQLAARLQQDSAILTSTNLSARERQLDAAAAAVWGLPEEDLKEIVNEFQRLVKADLDR